MVLDHSELIGARWFLCWPTFLENLDIEHVKVHKVVAPIVLVQVYD